MPQQPIVEPSDSEVDDPITPNKLALRSPQVPVTLTDLAALKDEGVSIIETRARIVAAARLHAIRATSPEDWVLNKAPDDLGGQIVGYLQDAGADRVRDIFGIEIRNVSNPEKIVGTDPNTFHFIVRGSGICKLTRQVVENMEGGRASTDEFCRDKTGTDLELAVRKAARANLDGGITRELAGLKSVPVDELSAAWTGTSKRIEQCRLGRGFGSRDIRMGARDEKLDVDPPVCPHCNSTGVLRPAKGTRKAFFGCPKYSSHPNQKWIVDAAEWIAKQKAAPAAPAAAAAAPAQNGKEGKDKPSAAKQPPMTAADIPFGGNREPGQEG